MEIENIKAQPREDIARIFPEADEATRERMVAIYLSGAAYIAGETGVIEGGCRYDNREYGLLAGEVRNLRNRAEGK